MRVLQHVNQAQLTPVDNAENGIVVDLSLFQLFDPAKKFRFGFSTLLNAFRQLPVLEQKRLFVQLLLTEKTMNSKVTFPYDRF